MPTTRPRFLLIGIAYLGFVSLGLPDGLLGVGWPSIRRTFDLPLGALGALLLTFTLGYLLASFVSGRLLAGLGVGTRLALSCLGTATSLLGFALAPAWPVMVGLGFLLGAGGGAIDAGLNTYVATHHGPRTLNWLHASFGLGAATGPLIMTAVLAADLAWRWGYAIVGLAQLALAACFGLTRGWWTSPGVARLPGPVSARGAASLRATLRLPPVWLGIALFFVYTGVELATGQWSYSLFTEERGVAKSTAGFWVSVYWGSLTVGRVLFGVVAGFARIELLLRACLVAIVAGTALIWLDLAELASFLGLALVGLALAPIFPSLIATTPARLGPAHTANAVGFQVAAAALGGALLPGLIGVLAGRIGLDVVAPALFVAACLLWGFFEALGARGPRPVAEGTPAPSSPADG
jgi:fucose permease